MVVTQAVVGVLSVLAELDKSALTQDFQLLGDCRLAHIEHLSNCRDGDFILLDKIKKDFQSCRISEHLEEICKVYDYFLTDVFFFHKKKYTLNIKKVSPKDFLNASIKSIVDISELAKLLCVCLEKTKKP